MTGLDIINQFFTAEPAIAGLLTEIAGGLIDRLVISKIFKEKDHLTAALKRVYYETADHFRNEISDRDNLYSKPYFNSPVLLKKLIHASVLDEPIDQLQLLVELKESSHRFLASEDNLKEFIWVFKQKLAADAAFSELKVKETYPYKIFSIDEKINRLLERLNEADIRTLQEYKIYSATTFADSRLVEEAMAWSLTRQFIWLDDLYVERNIERDIKSHVIQGAGNTTVIVAGEAGNGKTSLLWKLYRDFQTEETFYPLFLKSIHVKKLDLHTLIAIVQEAGKKPLLIVDTLDLLLHHENDREVLIHTIRLAADSGIYFIGTSRSQELKELKAIEADLSIKKFNLGVYEEMTELPKAIHQYSVVYNEGEPFQVIEETALQMLEAASNHTSLRLLCVTPLTQRMLFSMYAPGKTVPEINVFRLYSEFWNNRVVKDCRPGKAGQGSYSVSNKDLTETAQNLAILMLAEGNTIVSLSKYATLLLEQGISDDDIQALAGRGIIRYHAFEETAEFFHQTFFEHAAARALSRKLKKGAITLLKERLTVRWKGADTMNFFLIPIYQQVLLMGETSYYRQAVIEELQSLIHSSNLNQLVIFSYVYSLLAFEYAELDDQLLLRISHYKSDESVFLKRFLHVAANYNAARLPRLFPVLEAIWKRNIWNEQYTVLELLADLVGREPQRVLAFIESTDPIPRINQVFHKAGKREHKLAFVVLAKIFIQLYQVNSAMINFNLQRIYGEADGVVNKEILKLILHLKSNAVRVALVEAAAKAVADGFKSQDVTELPAETAALLADLCLAAFEQKKPRAMELVRELEQKTHPLDRIPVFIAIAKYAHHFDEKEANALFTYITASTAKLLFQWGRWMLAYLMSDTYRGSVLYTLFANDMEKKLAEGLMQVDLRSNVLLQCYAAVLERIELKDGNDLLRRLAPYYLKLEYCSRLKELARLLVYSLESKATLFSEDNQAFFRNHRSLGINMWRIIQKEKITNPELKQYVIRVLIVTRVTSLLAAIVKDIHQSVGLVAGSGNTPDYLQGLQEELVSFCQDELKVKEHDEITNAAHLWVGLLHLGLTNTTRQELKHFFPNTQYLQLRSWVVEAWGYCQFTSLEDLSDIIRELDPFFDDGQDFIVTKAQYAFFRLISRANFDCSAFSEKIFHVCFLKPEADKTGQKYKYVSRFMMNQVGYNLALSYELLRTLLTSELFLSYGEKRQKTIAHEIRNSSVQICLKATKEIRANYASLLEFTSCEYGRAILDGLAYHSRNFEEVRPIIEIIYQSPNTKPCVKSLIFNQLQIRSNAISWPELLELLNGG